MATYAEVLEKEMEENQLNGIETFMKFVDLSFDLFTHYLFIFMFAYLIFNSL